MGSRTALLLCLIAAIAIAAIATATAEAERATVQVSAGGEEEQFIDDVLDAWLLDDAHGGAMTAGQWKDEEDCRRDPGPDDPRLAYVAYRDHFGDRIRLGFARLGDADEEAPYHGLFSTVVMMNHGEAAQVWLAAVRAGACPAEGVAVLHVDKHSDMEAPDGDLRYLFPRGAASAVSGDARAHCGHRADSTTRNSGGPAGGLAARNLGDTPCPLQNDNYILSAVALAPALLDDVVWVYPMHCDHQIACRRSEAHACELGRRASDGAAHAFREAGAEAWGSKYISDWEREGTLTYEHTRNYKLKCGEHPHREEGRGPTHHPRAEFEALPRSGYTYAVMHTNAALAGALDVDPATSRYQEGSYILDIDLDYLITKEECAQESSSELGAAALRAGQRAARRIDDWLCPLTAQCGAIISELTMAPPEKTSITEAELEARVQPVRALLRSLPGPPCLVTVARSNEGANMPLAATIAMENAVLDALAEAFGDGKDAKRKTTKEGLPTAVQYTAAAVTPAAYARIMLDADLPTPPPGRVF